MNISTHQRIFPLILFFSMGLIAPAIAQTTTEPATETSTQIGSTLLAVNVFNLKVDVDTTVDIFGQTHFFSSRHNQYAGGRLTAHGGRQKGKLFSTCGFGGFTWGKSSFLLNWEEQGLEPFEPLEANFWTAATILGMEANLSLGDLLTVSPYVSSRLIWLRLNVAIDDEDFYGNAWKVGLDAGLKVTVNLGKVRLAGGAGLTHILGKDIDFEMDDSLTFNSFTRGSSSEYFLGVEMQWEK